MSFYDLNKVASKMKKKITEAGIPIKEPESIAFSTNTGAAYGICFMFDKNGSCNNLNENDPELIYAIRINPRFDTEDVSPFFIEAVTAHELLHCHSHREHAQNGGWEIAASKFVETFPEYAHVYDNQGLGVLTEKFYSNDPEKEKAYCLPFHPQDGVLVCTKCYTRQYFAVNKPREADEALTKPCPVCGGKMKRLFRRIASGGCGSAASLSELRSTYRGAEYGPAIIQNKNENNTH